MGMSWSSPKKSRFAIAGMVGEIANMFSCCYRPSSSTNLHSPRSLPHPSSHLSHCYQSQANVNQVKVNLMPNAILFCLLIIYLDSIKWPQLFLLLLEILQ